MPFAHDTRNLSPKAKALYAGVRATKDGQEVKTHDQMAALVNVAKHLGMFTEQHVLMFDFSPATDEQLADLERQLEASLAGQDPPEAKARQSPSRT